MPDTNPVPLATGVTLHVRHWPGDGVPFLLVHGLSSNARTWDGVAERLARAGHAVVQVDQRGHGRSEKPDDGYDFASVAADLAALIEALGLDRPVVAGQSWGGNVVLDLAVRRPKLLGGIVGVDGGTIELGEVFATWEDCAAALAPPRMAGLRLDEFAAQLRRWHPDWSELGIAGSLGNFEHLADGTIRPWLTFERHMVILRHLYEHQPSALFGELEVPVLLIGALGGEPKWDERKRAAVERAARSIARARAVFCQPADHDIHVQQPGLVAGLLTGALADGFFA
jgi:pimeloyl-ACP methyl ester carboxylesterase